MQPRFVDVDRETPYLLPPSVQDWLPARHLARFVVEIVEQLDLSSLKATYAGRGSQPYHPAMMVALLFYGYATGIFSSRKLERATYDSVAFRFIAANTHPDHDSLAVFRRRFFPQLVPLFAQILLIAKELKVFTLGNISLDGSKIKANASKHKALSYEYACKQEAQIKEEVAELLRLAEAADQAEIPDGMNIPEELERREQRLAAITTAKAEIESRAAERHAREQAAYEEKVAARAKKEEATGKKVGGKAPQPPVPGPSAKDQVNLTDQDSRIMPTSSGGFEQAYNVQAGVDTASKLIVTAHVTQSTNDKQELTPTLERVAALPEELGTATAMIADNGYYSENNVLASDKNGLTPYLAPGRQEHHPPLAERFAEPPPLPEDADPVTRMKHRLQTSAGKKVYAERKVTSEPVYGIIKEVMGFRRFLVRGFEAVQSEWNLVCMAYNIKKLFALTT